MADRITGKRYLMNLKEKMKNATDFDKMYLMEQYKGAKEMFDIFNRRNAEYRERNREHIREYDRAYKAKKRKEQSGQAESQKME